MVKKIITHCPTKDKTVTLFVDYIDSGCFEDQHQTYIKGRIASCSHNEAQNCTSCPTYKLLPHQMRQ